jgi:hypothetical protein
MLTWSDRRGEKQYADFTVPDDSPVYQPAGGQTVTIRCAPARPDRFYDRELLRKGVHTVVKTTHGVVLFVVVFGGLIFLRITSHMGWRR